MKSKINLRGVSTVNFYASDHEGAKKWYSELLGISPYFEAPGYFEFRLGDYQQELGIINKKYMPKTATQETGGAVMYWHVDDLEATVEQLKAKGAKEHEPITERGEGFITASVVDPFGNILGVMYNNHYLNTFSSLRTG